MNKKEMSSIQCIENYIKQGNDNKDDFVIILLGNVKEITSNFSDYDFGTSVISEYYSLEKYKKILFGLRNIGYEVLCYFDEMDFISDYLTGKIRNNYYKKMIVFNFAQKGIVQGRKSLVPAFCDMNEIIHTNSNAFVSSLLREKYFWYKILKDKFKVAKGWLFDPIHKWIEGSPKKGTKVIAKLTNQCSSIGLTMDNIFEIDENSEGKLLGLSSRYSSQLIVQEFISGYEIETPFINDNKNTIVLPAVGISIDRDKCLGEKIIDYNTRKNHNFSSYKFFDRKNRLSSEINKIVANVAKLLSIEGFGRIDFRIDKNDRPYITDINGNPHLIEEASFMVSLGYLGINDYKDLLSLYIGVTISRHPS
jgi:D-alanine-D-alanine ligase